MGDEVCGFDLSREAVERELLDAYAAEAGEEPENGSPERLILDWAAAAEIQWRALCNDFLRQNIPSLARGANLDALAELFTGRLERPGAACAQCTARFQIGAAQESAVLIPAGTRVTDRAATLYWETLEDAYIPPGETRIDLTVRCQTPGVRGNGQAAGSITELVDVYDFYSSCGNLTIPEGGADRASDTEFYELLRLSMDAESTAGAQGSYIYWAKQVSTEIADVAVVSPEPCVIKIYVLMEGGELAGEEMKRAVLAACNANERRPLTDWVFVEDAEIVPCDIRFTYFLQNSGAKSAAAAETAVREAVEKYKAWQCAKLGRDINPDRLREYLYAAGVKRVELAAPAFTVLCGGTDKETPQVARIETVSILNGGFEDE